MCKFCKMHTEGHGKWYLNPKGFSEELFYKLSLLDRILGREPRKVRDARRFLNPLGILSVSQR